MSKVVSQEQRLANRQNAQKSTGLATSDGKARVARNALMACSPKPVGDHDDGIEHLCITVVVQAGEPVSNSRN